MRLKKTLTTGIGILACLVSGFVSANTYINSNAQQSWLGRGVDTGQGRIKSTCVSGVETTTNAGYSSVSYSNGKTATQSLNEMSGQVGVSVNLGLFGGGASVSMHTRLEETTNTVSLVYRFSYQGKDYSLEQRQLNSTGQQLVDDSASASTISNTCGDSFINHVQLGNELYVVSQLSFADREDFRKFVTEIRVRVLFWTRTATIEDTFYEYAQNGVFSVKALSPNPLPATIEGILGADGEVHCGPEIQGSNTWMATCQTKSNDLFDYLFAESSNPSLSYSAWLADENNLGVTYYTTNSYKDSGHIKFEQSQPSAYGLWNSLSEQLLDALTEQYRLKNVIGAYAGSGRFDNTDYHQRLNHINANISGLEYAMENCAIFTDVNDCQIVTDVAMANLITVNL